MSEVQNISLWCELLNIGDCEKVINSLPTSMVDETGKELEMLGNEKIPGANFDACTPRLQTVMIPQRPGYIVWPPCTRTFRCAGCCTNARNTCQPSSLSEKLVKVFYTNMHKDRAHTLVDTSLVKIVEHVGCIPLCKTKAEDCKKFQKYDSRTCRCVCGPEREELRKTCKEKGTLHIWDEETCDCLCRNRKTTVCPSYYSFNSATCKCKPNSAVGRETYLDQLFERMDNGVFGHGGNNGMQHISKGTDVKIVAGSVVVFEKKSDNNKLIGQGRFIDEGNDDDSDDDDDVNDDDDEIFIAAKEQHTPSIAKDPCFIMKCSGSLKPRKLRSGKCQCLPDFRSTVLMFEQQRP